ncbi:MAG: hypothetical protein LBU46_04945 [Candidatus Accumulibacter sp.]|jgi:hypothetical protein|nr:hypothetical protein [Accumulibacter sp.]
MKTFAYTLRDTSGALKHGALRAADRADALRQLNAMGGAPVSVSEGAKGGAPVSVSEGAKGGGASRSVRPSAAMPRTAALAVALIGAAGAWVVWHCLRANKPPLRARQPARAALAVAPGRTAAPPSGATPETEPVLQTPAAPVRAAVSPPEPQSRTETQALISLASALPQAPLPAQAAAAPELDPQPLKTPAFNNLSDNVLALALDVPPGSPIPPVPIPAGMEQEFAKSLTNEIFLYDSDDGRTAALKERVAIIKNELARMAAGGRNVAEALEEYQRETNENEAMRSKAQRELTALYRQGSLQKARDYMNEMNQVFKEYGVGPISMPRQ